MSFIETESAALEALLDAVQEPSSAETTLILGRGSVDMHNTSGHHESRALGALPTTVLFALQEHAVVAGLMVVQARREVEDEGLKRKRTNHSEDI